MTPRTLGALGLCLLGQTVWAADICEPLREQIEFQIASTGATGFAVVVVDAQAEVSGKVVGTCAMGARKLVYVRAGGGRGVVADSTARPAVKRPAAPASPRGTDDGVITECRDGTVVRGIASCTP